MTPPVAIPPGQPPAAAPPPIPVARRVPAPRPAPIPPVDVELVKPVSTAPAAIPLAQRATISAPQTIGAGEAPVEPAIPELGVGPSIVRRPTSGGFNLPRWQTLALWGGLTVGIIGGLFLLLWLLRIDGGGPGKGDSSKTYVLNGLVHNLKRTEERAFKLILPHDHPWIANDRLKHRLRAIVALERSDPDVWLAVDVKDYGTIRPRDAELVKRAVELLERNFGENLEINGEPQERELAGVRAKCLEFRGDVNSVRWHGECYVLAHHGFGYWVIVAGGPKLEFAQQVLAELQKDKRGFVLDTERKGWSEQPPRLIAYRAAKYPFRMKAPEGVWEQFRATDRDENGVIYLHGKDIHIKDKTDPEKNLRAAQVLAFVLERKTADLKAAQAAARDYVEKDRQNENKNFKLEPAAEKDGNLEGQVVKVGNKLGRLAELRLSTNEGPKRYLMLAVVHHPERIYAVMCESIWDYHQIWRSDFLDLLATVEIDEKT